MPRRLPAAERRIRGSGSQGAGTRLASDALGEPPPRAADRSGPGHPIAARAARPAWPPPVAPPRTKATSAVACHITPMPITRSRYRATSPAGIALSDGESQGRTRTDPPFCANIASVPIMAWLVHIWKFGVPVHRSLVSAHRPTGARICQMSPTMACGGCGTRCLACGAIPGCSAATAGRSRAPGEDSAEGWRWKHDFGLNYLRPGNWSAPGAGSGAMQRQRKGDHGPVD